MKVRARQSGAQQSMFGRMVALVRIKGATRQRGLELRLRDLGKIWVIYGMIEIAGQAAGRCTTNAVI